jgi:GNAT superfamily N-acetyltransferase
MKVDFLPSASQLEVWTAEERPDLWEAARSLFLDVWPEYNLHGNDTGEIFSSLIPAHAHLQVLVHDREEDRIVARGRTIPFRWDGSLNDLPQGLDSVGFRALHDSRPANCLSALAAEVETDQQGRGLSRLVLQAMAASARAAGLSPLVAPVRPTQKHDYPLIPIAQYAQWKRSDGLPLDPWLRVHARLGATILRPEPRSLRIEAPTIEWEAWTGMAFPEDGEYVFPFGLAPLTVRAGIGSYWEPNVWMLHALD